MSLPFFLFFAIYGVVNVYLPLLLSNLGYSVSSIGLLLGIFEAAGLLFPIFISARVDKGGSYGKAMILLSLLMLAVLYPLTHFKIFILTALFLALYAVGYKGIVPIADALSSRLLGKNNANYGKVRVMGSIGFVVMTLLLQFFNLIDANSSNSIAFWILIPTVLFLLSIVLIPSVRKRLPPEAEDVQKKLGSEARGFNKIKTFSSSFWIGIGLIFLGFLGLTPSQRFFSLYVKDFLQLDSYAGLWALSAAAEVPFMFLSGYFIRKYGTEKILVISLLGVVARNLTYALIPSFTGAVLGQLYNSVCYGLFHPAAVVFACERAPKRYMALGLTLYSSVAVGLAAVTGNIIGGFVIDALGYRLLFIIFAIFPLVGLFCFRFFKNKLLAGLR